LVVDTKLLELISQAKKGNQSAYNTLLSTFWKDVFNFLKTKCSDDDEAEDITIITFSRAFDKLDTYDANYNFKTWLFSISRNISIDHFRKQKPDLISIHKHQKEAQNVYDEEPSPADKLIQKQNLSQLLGFIKQLKPHYKQVINLRYFMEMSYKEIAEEINEPVNNVKIKLLRAKKLLAEIIDNS